MRKITLLLKYLEKKQCRKGKIYWWKRISFIKPGPKVKKQRRNKIDGLLRN